MYLNDHVLAHRVVAFWPFRAGMSRTHRATVVGAGLVGVVKHVHHCHAEVHPQAVDHKEAVTGQQRQAIA